ncbi:MAG: acetyl-CoA carboxylase biotin carboxyl carrier protein [Candidatus Synoicihabitans palmerolidicus]|nr:acetyl-CoA carboxylase biotin carboxyl carrier protein [Candidatus Synoicihabitans palmerolidicus]
MKRAELNEFAVEEEGFKLKIRRGIASSSNGRVSTPPFVVTSDQASAAPTSPVQASPLDLNPTATSAEEAGIIYIKSPMIGTFYRSPSPESQAFADNGTKVTETSVVCIIEAMKIMNEIQAEVKGTVIEVLVENGEPVEYGQRLFKVKST